MAHATTPNVAFVGPVTEACGVQKTERFRMDVSTGTLSGRLDSNQRPLDPQSSALNQAALRPESPPCDGERHPSRPQPLRQLMIGGTTNSTSRGVPRAIFPAVPFSAHTCSVARNVCATLVATTVVFFFGSTLKQ